MRGRSAVLLLAAKDLVADAIASLLGDAASASRAAAEQAIETV